MIDIEDIVYSRLKTLAEELMQTQQMLLNKEEAVLELEKRIEESSETCEKKSEWVKEKQFEGRMFNCNFTKIF